MAQRRVFSLARKICLPGTLTNVINAAPRSNARYLVSCMSSRIILPGSGTAGMSTRNFTSKSAVKLNLSRLICLDSQWKQNLNVEIVSLFQVQMIQKRQQKAHRLLRLLRPQWRPRLRSFQNYSRKLQNLQPRKQNGNVKNRRRKVARRRRNRGNG